MARIFDPHSLAGAMAPAMENLTDRQVATKHG